MTSDPSIRDRTYQYFLQEAPELLQTLEQGLLRFKDDRSINQVHHLLRATHTLKGAANSVGLETIATVAHSLEDIFKTLCKPDVSIDAEVEALLFEGFECLRLPLVAELTGGAVYPAEILDRTATIFAQLQEKLGDCFDHNAPFPSSEELGFDVTQSIFEIGIMQRLQQLAVMLEDENAEELATALQTQAEVFLGIGESLNLPGFAAIAQATIAALSHHPDQIIPIAQCAIADFQAGQAAVLAGDRTQGGHPSEPLQQWADLSNFSVSEVSQSESSGNELSDDVLNQEALEENQLMEIIWGEAIVSVGTSLDPTQSALTDSFTDSFAPVSELLPSTPFPSQSPPNPTPFHAKASTPPAPTVRVNVKQLDHLNYSLGELLTHQNYQSLQTEQLQSTVRTLLLRLQHQQQLLQQLQIASDRQSNRSALKTKQKGKGNKGKSKNLSTAIEEPNQFSHQPSKFTNQRSSHLPPTNRLIQALLDDMVQLNEAADAIDLFTRQSNQTLEKQRHLLTHTRNALIEARMSPLGEIFDRLPHVLQQLETLYNKRVVLSLSGSEVLVDKVVAEKLYDPLLHLVRNAFDHGIEPIAVRYQCGKPEQGQIELCAYNQGKYLVIEVRDDGKGLDFDQIRQRAVEQNLIPLEQAAQMSQAQLIDVLFEPGFSTTAQVNDLSGRGIGLDVVQNQIKALQGLISVQSAPQCGTTFTLQIPLNLIIAQLLICEAGSKAYAFLDDAIEQVLLPQSCQIQERNACKVLRWQGEEEQNVPLYALSTVLNYHSVVADLNAHAPVSVMTNEAAKPVILLRHQERFLGLEVDRLIGEQELVIRPLGTMINAPDYVHGASILADGKLALVIEGMTLLQTVLTQPHSNRTHETWSPIATLSSGHSSVGSLNHSINQSELSSSIRTTLLPPVPKAETRSNHRILIVEDSITARQALAFALEKAGYQVTQATNGQEAIAQLQHQANFQLVICDIEMPVMNGFEVLRRSQQIPALDNLPILILSSRSDEKHRMLASQLGASAYMTKPYIEHKLLALVADLLVRYQD